jgi:hypothetical protein
VESADDPTYEECLKSKMFWVIYVMSTFSICK